jgi:lipoprotein-releasing system permease protein
MRFVVLVTIALAACGGSNGQARFPNPTMPHIIVSKVGNPVADYAVVAEAVRAIDPSIVAATRFTFSELIASAHMNHTGVAMKGVPDGEPRRLAPAVTDGSLAPLHAISADLPAIVVGDLLARDLHLAVGTPLTLHMPIWDVERDPPEPPHHLRFRVAAIYRVGVDEIDRRMLFVDLTAAQALLGYGDAVNGLEIELADPSQAPAIADRLRSTLGSDYIVVDWKQ